MPAGPLRPREGRAGLNFLVAYIRLTLGHSRLLLAVALVLIAISAWLAAGVGFEFSLEALFQADSPEAASYREFLDRFGREDDRAVFVAYKTPNVFEKSDREAVAALAEDLRTIPAVKRVFSLPAMMEYAERMSRDLRLPGVYDAEVLRRDLTGSPVTRGLLCSADGTTACLVVSLADLAAEEEQRTLEAVQVRLDGARERTGIFYHLAGIPVIEAEYGRMIRRDFFTILPLSILLVLVLLALYFRNLIGTALLVGSIFASIVGSLAMMRVLGVPIGILSNMVPTLILVVGLSESIHVLSHYHEEVQARHDAREAVAWTILYMAGACFLTSLTNALGFGTMMISPLQMMREFGYTTALGIAISYLAAVVLLPTLLDLVPAAQLRVRFGQQLARLISERLIRAIGWVNERARGRVYAAFAVLLLICVWGTTRIHVRSSWLMDMRPDSELYGAHIFIERNLSSVFSTDFWVKTDSLLDPATLQALDEFEQAIVAAPGFAPKISWSGSIVGMVKDANAQIAREEHLVRKFGLELLKPGPDLVARVRHELLAYDLDAQRTVPSDPARLARVRDWLEKRSPDRRLLRGTVDEAWKDTRLTFRMSNDSQELGRFVAFAMARVPQGAGVKEVVPTGKSYMAKAILDSTITNSLWATLQLAAGLFVMFALIFRSLGVGLMAMVPNLIPPIVTAGIMGHFGFDLNYSTVTTFAITLGLTVENTVQYMLRWRSEVLLDGDHTAAMYRALEGAGKPMLFANALLIAGFSMAMASSFKLSQTFGLLGVVSIATATLADVFVTASLPLVFKPGISQWKIPEEKLARLRARVAACLGTRTGAEPTPGPAAAEPGTGDATPPRER